MAPSIGSVTASSDKIKVGEDIILTAVASDTEGDAMVFTWTHDMDA